MDAAGAILERRTVFGMTLGLERIEALLDRLDEPQRKFRSLHVVGTNGKSSTVRFTAAALAAQGIRVGAYLSPHIAGWHERVLVAEPGGRPEPIAADVFLAALEVTAAAAADVDAGDLGPCTQFEVLTAAAFLALARQGVEVAVIEAGLGGRLDATNVINAPVVALTGVALEHTEQLGDTRERIAAEKIAVLPAGGVLLVGGADPELAAVAERLAAERGAGSLLFIPPDVIASDLPLLAAQGAFQRRNATLALAAAEVLVGEGFDRGSALAAVARVQVPGRLEVLGSAPLVVRDAAHNPESAATLAAELSALVGSARPVVGVIAVLADKDVAGILDALAPSLDVVVTTDSGSDRALPAAALAEAARAAGVEAVVESDPVVALEQARARAGAEGAVVITGSLTLLAALAAE
jgi:dihydrofolate synthase/folylpolyglutamate synthase